MYQSNIAEAGTLALEWMTLSKYTKDDQYRILGENALRKIAQLVRTLVFAASSLLLTDLSQQRHLCRYLHSLVGVFSLQVEIAAHAADQLGSCVGLAAQGLDPANGGSFVGSLVVGSSRL